MKAGITTALLVSAIIFATFAAAQIPAVPRYINFQGKLADTNGIPLSGTYEITFNIYSNSPVPAAENWVWGETHESVEVQRGLFSVLLGSVTNLDLSCFPFDATGATNRWLEIRVGTDVLSPTKEFVSVAYAFRASDADTVDGSHADDLAYTNQSPISITDRTIGLNYDTNDFVLIGSVLFVRDQGIDHGSLTGLADDDHTQYIEDWNELIVTGTVPDDFEDGDIAWSELSGIPADFSDGDIAWSELSSIPTCFADNVDDVGITSESDPIYGASPASGITAGNTNNWTTTFNWGNHGAQGYLTSEDDPEVGGNTENYVPRWNGSALVKGSIFDLGEGNIGIGKTPDAGIKLDVNGWIQASWIQLSAPDYRIQAKPIGLSIPVLGFRGAAGWHAGYTVLVPDTNGFRVMNWQNNKINMELREDGNLHIPLSDVYAWNFNRWSDSRIKLNQKPLSKYGRSEVLALQVKEYDRAEWSFDPGTGEIVINEKNTTNDFGLVAQDVDKIIPEAVTKPEDETKGFWSLDYGKIMPVLIKAIQEQQEEIESLKKQHQEQISSFEKRIKALEAK